MALENPSSPPSVPFSPPTSNPPTSSLALASLVTGILGLTFFPLIGSIIAVVTGRMARKEIRESAGALSGDGMATAGLVLGWLGVGMTVFGLCIALFVVALVLLIIPLSISTQHSGLILPGLLTLLF